jgi:hypothetical protein
MHLFGRKSLGAELRGSCAFARESTGELRRTRVRNERTRPAASDRAAGHVGGCTSWVRWFLGAIRGPCLYGPRSRAKYKRAVPILKIAVTARRVHTSRKRVIGLRLPALVLTFDSREKALDRIVARSVPGRLDLAQVESSDPPAQLSTDCWG